VPNRYRAALVSAATRLATIEHDVTAAFDAAVATMHAGAWEGHAATVWFGELRARRATSGQVVRQVSEACRGAAAAQPDDVPGDDRRARWALLPQVR
jgi:hypothetical protein